jgi:hypothetical protein
MNQMHVESTLMVEKCGSALQHTVIWHIHTVFWHILCAGRAQRDERYSKTYGQAPPLNSFCSCTLVRIAKMLPIFGWVSLYYVLLRFAKPTRIVSLLCSFSEIFGGMPISMPGVQLSHSMIIASSRTFFSNCFMSDLIY